MPASMRCSVLCSDVSCCRLPILIGQVVTCESTLNEITLLFFCQLTSGRRSVPFRFLCVCVKLGSMRRLSSKRSRALRRRPTLNSGLTTTTRPRGHRRPLDLRIRAGASRSTRQTHSSRRPSSTLLLQPQVPTAHLSLLSTSIRRCNMQMDCLEPPPVSSTACFRGVSTHAA